MINFSHAGDVLISNSWDGTVRLWDPWTGQQLLNSNQGGTQLSQSDRLMGGCAGSRVALWEVELGQECRRLFSHGEVGKGPWSLDFSRDGYWLVSTHENGVRLWDLASWKEVALLPTKGSHFAVFHPNGKTLITTGTNGARRWDVRANHQGEEETLEIGPPRLLEETAASEIWGVSFSGNGRFLALADRTHGQAMVVDFDDKPSKTLVRYHHSGIANIAISPDGQWVASAPWGDPSGRVRVFDVLNRKNVKDFLETNSSPSLTFSPDGKWLVMPAGKTYRFWEISSWKAGAEVEGAHTTNLPLPLAFSRDGKMLAIAPLHSPSAEPVRILDSATGREIATLSLPYPELVHRLAFSADGSQLAAACSGHGIQVWDLRAIRQQLADMSLDWDLPPYPPVKFSSPAKLLQVKVVGGNLAEPQKAHDPSPPASLHDQLALYSLAIAIAPLPFHPASYHQRGHVYERLGQSRQAIEDFSAALLRQPANSKLQAGLLAARGRNHRRLNNYGHAIADLEEALKLDSEQPVTCNDLAWFYVTGPEHLRNPNRALTLAKKANVLRPNHWFFLNTLGVTYYRLGQYAEAVEKLESSLRDSQARAGAFDLFFLSMCHARLGDSTKARDCYDRAVKWITEHQGQLSPEWVEELKNFRAEADAVLAKPAIGRSDE